MARRPSVRLWQTELFVIVTIVAILILSVTLSQGLQITLNQLGESDSLSDATAFASQLSKEFPLTVESRARIRSEVDQHGLIYGDAVWVYDIDGTMIASVGKDGPPASVLEEARIQGLADSPPYSHMTLKPGGYVVAGKVIHDPDGRRAAVLVIASPVTDSLAVLDAVRSRLWTTFWIALIVSGLLGFAFAEFIGRRVRQMSLAAVAIADGDFDQRLPTGLVPDEIHELAESYNRMAVTLGDAFSALRAQEQAQRRFVADASHEMRTPISAIKGLLELLDSGAKDDPAVRDDFLRTMTLEVDRLGRLVADLLTLAQLDAGSLTLKQESMPAAGLLDDIATVLRPLAAGYGVTLAVDAPDDRLEVLCDRDRITQVLVVLLDNALKHSESGETVTLSATPGEDAVSLAVHNEGAAIDPDAIPRLFDRFFRVDEARTTPKGTGLGLSIAKEIIEAHESSIAVESTPGNGVTFRFDLPRSPL